MSASSTRRRALACRVLLLSLLSAAILEHRAVAFQNQPTDADAAHAQSAEGAPLSLDEAVQLAVSDQPALIAGAAAARAARAQAIAQAQLPDPKLKGGLTDFTATGADAGTFRRESDTQLGVAIAQEFPRGDTLRLRGALGDAQAVLAETRLLTERLLLERDVALAWVEVWKPEQTLLLTRAAAREAELQAATAQAAYGNGRSSQAEVRAARLSFELLRDDVAKQAQDVAHAQSQLSRWIGEAAYREVPASLPQWPPPPPLAALLTSLRTHPHVGIAIKEIAVAEQGVALAKQAYKPDWSVELNYAYRPAFSDYVGVQVGIDLPVFTAKRQDRELEGRLAELDRAQALREDDYREHAAEARLNFADWNLIGERLARFDTAILPEAQARADAARQAWASGNGTLAAVLDARRAQLEARMRRLELEADRAKHALELRYLAGHPGDAHE